MLDSELKRESHAISFHLSVLSISTENTIHLQLSYKIVVPLWLRRNLMWLKWFILIPFDQQDIYYHKKMLIYFYRFWFKFILLYYIWDAWDALSFFFDMVTYTFDLAIMPGCRPELRSFVARCNIKWSKFSLSDAFIWSFKFHSWIVLKVH